MENSLIKIILPPKLSSQPNSLKELCIEDKVKIGQLVQKIAIEKANRKKFEDKLLQESQNLEEKLFFLKQEKQKLKEESELVQLSLSNSLVQIESLQNTPTISLSMPTESKRITPEPSFCSSFKENSTSMSVQTVIDKEIQHENPANNDKTEFFIRKKVFDRSDDVRLVLEKALQSSLRVEKIFNSRNNSISEPSKDFKFYDNFDKIDKNNETCDLKNKKNNDDEIIILGDTFYDAGILDVINQMEEFEEC